MIVLPSIYLTGLAGSGKTFCAAYLNRQYGTIPMSEGTKLKAVCARAKLPDIREIHINIGEAFREEFGPTFWLDRVLEKIKGWETHNPTSVLSYTIDDVRHPEDAALLDSLGWVGIHVFCRTDVRLERIRERGRDEDMKQLERPSEQLCVKIKTPHTVDNTGDIEGTYKQLDYIIEDITGVAWPTKPEVSE